LEQVEIDHTKADLIVIDETDHLPLGRFTLTYCLDLCTRYPLGFYLGFEPPGYYPIMECLYHAIAPKDNYPERFGTAHPWLACGVPSVLKVDNGKDFISQSLDDACLSLGIVLNRGPVRTPEFNGYAAYCTSFERSKTTSGKQHRPASFRPCCLVGASATGSS
jgi:putative transposase